MRIELQKRRNFAEIDREFHPCFSRFAKSVKQTDRSKAIADKTVLDAPESILKMLTKGNKKPCRETVCQTGLSAIVCLR